MARVNAKSHFLKRVHGANFMTPHVVEYGWIREGLLSYELSEGRGPDNQPVWGVTISKRIHPIEDTISRAWSTRREATGYIDYLKVRLRKRG